MERYDKEFKRNEVFIKWVDGVLYKNFHQGLVPKEILVGSDVLRMLLTFVISGLAYRVDKHLPGQHKDLTIAGVPVRVDYAIQKRICVVGDETRCIWWDKNPLREKW